MKVVCGECDGKGYVLTNEQHFGFYQYDVKICPTCCGEKVVNER